MTERERPQSIENVFEFVEPTFHQQLEVLAFITDSKNEGRGESHPFSYGKTYNSFSEFVSALKEGDPNPIELFNNVEESFRREGKSAADDAQRKIEAFLKTDLPEDKQFPGKGFEVRERYHPKLVELPGITGTGVVVKKINDEHVPFIRIYVENEEMFAKVPYKLDGIPVEKVVSGQIVAG